MAVRWLDVDPSQPEYNNLYASHKLWVDKIAAGFSHNAQGRPSISS